MIREYGFGPWVAAVIRTLASRVGSYDLVGSPDGYPISVFCDENKTRVRRCAKNWIALCNASLFTRDMRLLFPQLRPVALELGLIGWHLRIAPNLLDPAAWHQEVSFRLCGLLRIRQALGSNYVTGLCAECEIGPCAYQKQQSTIGLSDFLTILSPLFSSNHLSLIIDVPDPADHKE